jgi:hypothetical protein
MKLKIRGKVIRPRDRAAVIHPMARPCFPPASVTSTEYMDAPRMSAAGAPTLQISANPVVMIGRPLPALGAGDAISAPVDEQCHDQQPWVCSEPEQGKSVGLAGDPLGR